MHCNELSHDEEMVMELNAFILSTKGENFGHAIFEAMQVGRPVVISDQTPWQYLEEKQTGWAIPLQKPEKWQQALEKLIQMEQQEYNTWCQNAKKVADNYLEQANFEEQYRELFEI